VNESDLHDDVYPCDREADPVVFVRTVEERRIGAIGSAGDFCQFAADVEFHPSGIALSSLFKLARPQERGRRRRETDNLIGFCDIPQRYAETWRRDPRRELLTDESQKGCDPGCGAQVIGTLRSNFLDEAAFSQLESHGIAKIDRCDCRSRQQARIAATASIAGTSQATNRPFESSFAVRAKTRENHASPHCLLVFSNRTFDLRGISRKVF
jgi:hypothetical protein